MDIDRVLLVDDDTQLLRVYGRALENADILCDTAKDGVEARNLTEKHVYRIVITDLAMPRLHGHALVKQLIDKSYPAKFVVYTGVIEPKLIREMMRIGVAQVLIKPMDIGLFTGTIQGLLDRMGHRRKTDGQHETEATIQDLEKKREQAEKRFLGSIRLMSNLIGKAGGKEGSHASRVEHIALRIARELDLERSDLHALQAASLLHEIGQIGLADALRTARPEKLTGNDLENFRKYPEVGAILLSEIEGADDVVATVDAHCEHYDGTGFPRGLVGDAIPLTARILRYADGIDTLKMNASGDIDRDQIREHLKKGAGKIYDPRLLNVVLSILDRDAGDRTRGPAVEIDVSKLRPGMRKSGDLHSKGGLLLVRDGAMITTGMIRLLNDLMPDESIAVEKADWVTDNPAV